MLLWLDIDSVGMAETVFAVTTLLGVLRCWNEESVSRLVQEVLKRFKKIDLFCANAFTAGGESINQAWQKIWDVNVMSHVFAARAVLPSMLDRASFADHFLCCNLLSQVGSTLFCDETCCDRFRGVALNYVRQARH